MLAVESIVLAAKEWKWSYRMNILINLEVMLRKAGWDVSKLKPLRKKIELKLLYEDPKKARTLSPLEVRRLVYEPEARFAIVNGLMLPFGMRFQDACRIRVMDVEQVKGTTLTVRIRQAKNIRRRSHQKWHVMSVPRPLMWALLSRLKEASQASPLVTVTYAQFLAYLKKTLDKSVSTYSIRLTALNAMAERVRSIEELQRVSLHRNADQLRWYLNKPLKDDADLQAMATRWTASMCDLPSLL